MEDWKLAALVDVVGDVDSWAKVQQSKGPDREEHFSKAEREQLENDGYTFINTTGSQRPLAADPSGKGSNCITA